jgi:hypothetical protein
MSLFYLIFSDFVSKDRFESILKGIFGAAINVQNLRALEMLFGEAGPVAEVRRSL